MTEGKAYGTVLIKAKAILDYMMTAESGITLKDISDGVSSSKSTTLKILTTLTDQNLIWRDEESKKYYFGTELIGYGQRAMADFDVSRISLPYLSKLRDVTAETVHLGIQQNDKIVYLEKLDSPQSVNLQSKIGGKLNMYSSAMGKAILAEKTSSELDKYFSRVELKAVTRYTVTSISELYKQISDIKTNGYSIDDKENQEEVICVGAALVKHGKILGAFSVSTPEYRIDNQKLKRLEKDVLETKKRIEEEL